MAHFGIKIDYQNDTMSVQDGPWCPAQKGSRGEYMLDIFPRNDTRRANEMMYDLMTDKTIENIVDLIVYLEQTGRTAPEIINPLC